MHFKYLLLNESAYSKETLLQIRNIVSTLFLAEAHYNIELLRQELSSLYKKESDKQAVSILLNWFQQLVEHGHIAPEDYQKLDYVYKSQEEVQAMLVATLELERKREYQRIREEERTEGRTEGQRITLQTTILRLLTFHFTLSSEEQSLFAQQLAAIEDVSVLNELLNGLLTKDITLAKAQALITQHTPPKATQPKEIQSKA